MGREAANAREARASTRYVVRNDERDWVEEHGGHLCRIKTADGFISTFRNRRGCRGYSSVARNTTHMGRLPSNAPPQPPAPRWQGGICWGAIFKSLSLCMRCIWLQSVLPSHVTQPYALEEHGPTETFGRNAHISSCFNFLSFLKGEKFSQIFYFF